ncbi:MAG TPA: hypothetical protein VE685_17610 [Thermoanaerobaculia bacterium]|nr:hypothetical protein [Thermoanaerobaculia bacterium]
MIGRLPRAAILAFLLAGAVGGRPAAPAGFQEQVDLDLPDSVIFQITDVLRDCTAGPSLLSFRHALLQPGRKLRIGVRIEGLERGTGHRVSFKTAAARGGTGFRGRLRPTEFTTVFESAPAASSGSVEILWTLDAAGRTSRAGPREIMLRWKLESIPADAWVVPGSPSPQVPSAPPTVRPLLEPGERPHSPAPPPP